MTTKSEKPQPTIALTLKPGQPTPAQREAGRKLWQKLLSTEVKTNG